MFWIEGFWAPGFWAEGFWLGFGSGTTPDEDSLNVVDDITDVLGVD